MPNSLLANGATVSRKAIYRWIYALLKAELAREAIMLRFKLRARHRRPLGERAGGRIVGMISTNDRPDTATDRRVPGHWEGDLIIGAHGASAAATLVGRTGRFTIILGLPEGRSSDALIDALTGMPELVRGCLDLLAEEPEPLVTTAMVIAEAAYLLDRDLGP